MSMSLREVVDRLNQLRAGLKSGPADPELESLVARATEQLRRAYSPDALREALARGEAAPTGLEEAMTTLQLAWSSRRGLP